VVFVDRIGAEELVKKIDFLRVPSLGTQHAFTTRKWGVSRGPYNSLNLGPNTEDRVQTVRQNQAKVLAKFGVDFNSVCGLSQVHGACVVDARASWFKELADGMTTDQPDITLVVGTADCYPLLLHDPVQRAVGAAHAGWRGTVAGIALSLVRAMQERYGSAPSDLRVAIGPGILGSCYRVGPEVAEDFRIAGFGREVVKDNQDGGSHVDLLRANIMQMVGAGVLRSHIECTRGCTHCDEKRFFSHRRDGNQTGRHWALIRLLQ
jgi:YfiH family protein